MSKCNDLVNFAGSTARTRKGRRCSDLDVLAFWKCRKLGVGNQTVIWQLQQMETTLAMLRDQVAAEIMAASQDIQNYRQQMKATQARDAYRSIVSKYNQAQFRLLRASGQFPRPIEEAAANKE